jgi:hypothetical protein
MAIWISTILTSTDVVILFLSDVNVTEPFQGENRTETVCFNVNLNLPRLRDAIFTFNASNLSTATPGLDFYPTYLVITIPASFTNNTSYCVNLTILGDGLLEDDEVIVFNVAAIAEEDMVLPPNTPFLVTIVDSGISHF